MLTKDREKLLDEIEEEEKYCDFVAAMTKNPECREKAEALLVTSKERLRVLYRKLTDSIMLAS